MRPDAAAADRKQEVRDTARSWRRTGVINDTAFVAIEGLFPDDRKRVGPMFRLLLFFFTAFATFSAYLLVSSVSGSHFEELAILALFFGIACAGLTEYQVGRLKRRQGGTEAATSFMTVVFLAFFGGWFIDGLHGSSPSFERYIMLYSSAVFAVAAWRWGYEVYAGVAAAAASGFLATLPGARILWLVGSAAILLPALTMSEDRKLAPSHRRCWLVVFLVALAALYMAVHIGSYDKGLLENRSLFQGYREESFVPNPFIRVLAILATALLPLATLAMGIRKRDRLLLAGGVLLGAASLVTLRFYVHVAPLWVILIASGTFLIAVVVLLRRWLDAAHRRERHGFTAEPLLEDLSKIGLMELAAGVSTLSPATQASPPHPGFQGGGGSSGGGGATGTF